MAKKKKDRLDAALDALTENTTAAEILQDGSLLKELQKRFIERALEAEMVDHIGYEKHDGTGDNSGNSYNGPGRKNVITDAGRFEIEVPRDRNSTFEPQLVQKRQIRLKGFDEKVLFFYSQGQTVREIQEQLLEVYNTEVSPALISRVTDAVLTDFKEWQNRPLDAVYPVIFMDAIHMKIRTDGRVRNRAVYLALGINLEGNKELLGLWIGEEEGAKFWLNILTDLKNRGIEDILIASVDGLKGFPEAIGSVFPETEVQLCVVHIIRNSLNYVGWKDKKAVAMELKNIYKASTAEAAETALDAFEAKYGDRFPMVVKTWRSRWENIIPFFNYPPEIRKVIYTTNAIESVNAQLRKVTRKRGAFPTEDSVKKVLYLAIIRASRKWSRPIQNWSAALNYFSIVFEGRVPL